MSKQQLILKANEYLSRKRLSRKERDELAAILSLLSAYRKA